MCLENYPSQNSPTISTDEPKKEAVSGFDSLAPIGFEVFGWMPSAQVAPARRGDWTGVQLIRPRFTAPEDLVIGSSPDPARTRTMPATGVGPESVPAISPSAYCTRATESTVPAAPSRVPRQTARRGRASPASARERCRAARSGHRRLQPRCFSGQKGRFLMSFGYRHGQRL
jgi:hypothetical protein